MGFHEVQFPTTISRGARCTSMRHSQLLRLSSGSVLSVTRWPNDLWEFDVGFGVRGGRTYADLRTVHEFWLRRGGHEYGFRFENPFENSTASDGRSAPDDEDETLGEGDGTTTTFQLVKTYTDSTGTTTRTITKPQSGTVVVALDGAAQTAGVDFTVDTSTGVVTFTTAPLGGGTPEVVTAGCKFDLPCKFGPDMRGLDMILESAAGEVGRAPSIPIVEQGPDVMTPELPYTGEGSDQSFSADLVYDYSMGQFVRLTPSTSGLSFVLPTITDLPNGGPILHLVNASGSNSVACVNRTSGSTEFTIPASSSAIVGIVAVAGVKQWEALKGTS